MYRFRLDIIAVITLVLLVAKLAWDLPQVRDIDFGDETVYLYFGTRLGDVPLVTPDCSPLYIVWYWLLGRFASDPVWIYNASWVLVTGMFVLSMYGLLRRLAVSPAASLCAAAAWLVSTIVTIPPYPIHFATVLLLVGAIAISYLPTAWTMAIGLGWLLVIVSYARPEYYLPYGVWVGAIALGSLMELWRRQIALRDVQIRLLVVLAPALVLMCTLGFPLAGGRSFFAFEQHYALNVVTNERLDVDPWWNSQYFLERDYRRARSLPAAYQENPFAFCWHIATNIHTLPRNIALWTTPDLALAQRVEKWIGGSYLIVAAVGLYGAAWMLRDLKPNRDKAWLGVFCLSMLVMLPATIATVMFYPRAHYLVAPLACLTALALGSWHKATHRDPPFGSESIFRPGPPAASSPDHLVRSLVVLCAIAAVLLTFVPNRAHGWTPQHLFGAARPPAAALALPGRATIAKVRALPLPERIVVLDYYFSRLHYTTRTYERVKPLDKPANLPFDQFVREHGINVVIVDRDLQTHLNYRFDPAFAAFLARPEEQGFIRHNVTESIWLAVRPDAAK